MRVLALAFLLAAPLAAQSVQSNRLAGPPPPGADLRCGARPIGSVVYDTPVDLAPWVGCGASIPWAWTVRETPDGRWLYASLFGGLIGNGGCTVVRIDAATLQVVASFQVGESPEEIAFTTNPAGALQLGFVTNSSSSTVSVFDASDAVVHTLRVPFDDQSTYPTAFPFGITVSPDQRTVFVGTQDYRGIVHAFDVATMSLVPQKSIQLGADHVVGRMQFVDGELVITATESNASGGSTAKVFFVDPDAPSNADELVLRSSIVRYPSAQDFAVDCDGRLYVAGFDMGRRVYVVDRPSRSLLGTIPTNTSTATFGSFSGVGISPDGMLAVTELVSSEISIIDTWTGTWVRTLDENDYHVLSKQPNDAVFAADGERLFVPFSFGDHMGVFDIQ